jgi:hypothetical protein
VRVAVRFDGAFGVLLDRGAPFAVSCERTYGLGTTAAPIVKIPAGTYTCMATHFAGGGYDTFEVTGVKGHDRLLFHRGNTGADSDGCILVGEYFGQIGGVPAVMLSQMAFTAFMRRLSGRSSFTLEVKSV